MKHDLFKQTIAFIEGVGHVLSSQASNIEMVTITNGNLRRGFVAYELEIRDADKIAFFRSSDVFNGELYRGHVLLRNHLQIDKLSNVVSDQLLSLALLFFKLNSLPMCSQSFY